MLYLKKLPFALLITLAILSCDEKTNEPLISGKTVPAEVENVEVENVPGGAKLTYSLPKNSDVLYVVAEYKDNQGNTRSVKSSRFQNSIYLEGFAEEKDYVVRLYAVNESENRSSAYETTIHPDRAPIRIITDSLMVEPTFGGLLYDLRNEFDMQLTVFTLVKNDEGEWEEFDRYYTDSEKINHSVRGLEPDSTDFAIYVQDEYRNHSDTVFTSLTPFYEEEVDKSTWEDAGLVDDFNEPWYGPLSSLWDEGDDRSYFFQDKNGYPELTGLPTWVTIDLGQEWVLGRMKLFMVKHAVTWQYGSCSIQEFEIWGSNNPTIDWNDWTLLGEFGSTRPSGRSVGEPLTDDDQAQLDDGEDFEFPPITEAYRYIRLKVNRTWGRENYFCSLEISFWGQKD